MSTDPVETPPPTMTPAEQAVHRAEVISRYINATWTTDHGYSVVALLIAAAFNLKRNGITKDDFLHLASSQWDALQLRGTQINLDAIPVSSVTH